MGRTRYMLSVILAVLALAGASLGAGSINAASTSDVMEFQALLLQSNEVPPVPYTGASGRAKLMLDQSKTTNNLTYEVRVTGIVSATLGHIHRGAIGANGPVVVDLLGTKSLTPSTILTGTATLTSTQITTMIAGNYYVNIHTVDNPAGELRGQIVPKTTQQVYSAALRGRNEVPPVTSAGVGLAVVRLNDAGTQFDYEIQVTGIPSATLTHIHRAPVGVNGPIVFDLLEDKQLNPSTILTGTSAISPTQLADLRNGQYYVNVHTVANRAGELRGQLAPGDIRFFAPLSGASEVPPVTTNATGLVTFELQPETGVTHFLCQTTGLTATMAHIHEGAPTVNGPIRVDLLELGGGKLDSQTPISGTFTLTGTQMLTMLNEDYYVNVHTAANRAGEIRGQIRQEVSRLRLPLVSR